MIKNIIAVILSAFLLTACLEETFPTSVITEEQLAMSSNALAALNRASAAALNSYGSDYGNYGYPGIMVWRDAMLADIPIYASDYDYHSWYASCKYLGNFNTQTDWWSLFYKVVLNANLFISAAEGNEEVSVIRNYGNALVYRAFAYMDLARMYEFHKTGYPVLDDEATRRGIYGLTVPIYSEKTTEKDGENNPRAPFYQMYRFILTDLNKAEEYLAGYEASSVNEADATIVYGLKARFWLELASRFNSDLSASAASDLQTMLENENNFPEYDKLGVKTAKDCYANALTYAEKAMAGHTPITKSEWYNPTTGFNTAISSWIFGMVVGTEDVQGSWKSYTGNLSPETTYGTANSLYSGFRMIDASLYKKIGDGDWRKLTWIAPGDAKKTSAYSKYADHTLLDETEFAECPALTNLKFHPGSGCRDNYLEGNVVDIPFMRVEEMYLIAAEAKAYTEGLSAGVNALKSFVNTYRYEDGSYSPSISTYSDFFTEILTQRRIEFWGEGIVYFDYRRMNKAVIKGYSGSNHDISYQINSLEGYCCPWTTIYITSSEYQYNHGLDLDGTPGGKNNPDPSGVGDKY